MAAVELTKNNFNETIQKNNMVLVDFWAPWCGPCQRFGPIYDRVSKEFPDIVFGKVNTEEQQEIAAMFDVRSIPTLMIFRDKEIIFYQPGLIPEDPLKDIIQKAKTIDMDQVRKEIAEEESKQQVN